MFHTDDSPTRVIASPQFTDILRAEQARNPQVAVLLDDDSAKLLPQAPTEADVIYLGELATAGTQCYASGQSRTQWWRYQAQLRVGPGASREYDYQLTELTEDQLAATIAAGPLPRGPRSTD